MMLAGGLTELIPGALVQLVLVLRAPACGLKRLRVKTREERPTKRRTDIDRDFGSVVAECVLEIAFELLQREVFHGHDLKPAFV